MLKKVYLFFVFILTCTAAISAETEIISAGTSPAKFVTDKIAGNTLQVICIMPYGKNMHDISATPAMLKAASNSKVFFHTGLLFENQIAEVINDKTTKCVDLSFNIPKLDMPMDPAKEAGNSIEDVHTWFSYNNLLIMAGEVLRTLSEIYPEHSAKFRQNHDTFKKELETSRDRAMTKLNRFRGRTFLTHHAAFGYFANDFGLTQLPFEFNGRELSPRNIALLSKYARQHNIRRVFIQSTASSNLRDSLRRNINADFSVIDPADYNVLDTMNRFVMELEASFE